MALKMESEAMIMDLSDGLVIEILVRLPVISLLQFKCVCKAWCSLISSPFFIAKYLQVCNSTTNYPNLLVYSRTRSENDNWIEKMFIVSHETLDVLEIQENPPRIWPNWFPKILGSCNGLVCLYDQYNGDGIVWNPRTRETKVMPRPLVMRPFSCEASGFGFDEKNNDYKVFQIHLFIDDSSDSETEAYDTKLSKLGPFQFEVYSLRTDYWKLVTGTQGMSFLSIDENTVDAYTNGMVSWLVENQVYWHREILSFDISNENFIMTPLPSEISAEHGDIFIYVGVFNGSVAVVNEANCSSTSMSQACGPNLFHLWVLCEVGIAESWTKVFTFGFLHWLSPHPLVIWNESLVDLLFSGEQPFIYDFANKEERSIGIPRLHYWGAVTYTESLVPIKG